VDYPREEKRLEIALAEQRAEFEAAEQRLRFAPMEASLPEQAELLEIYIMFCRDPRLWESACALIRRESLRAEDAWEKAVRLAAEDLQKINLPYLRERSEEIMALGSRVAARLRGAGGTPAAPSSQKVLLAHDLTPADILALEPQNILGLATEMGGLNSHIGIMARSLHLPCVLGVTGLDEAVEEDCPVVVDALKGRIIVYPDEAELKEYEQLRARSQAHAPGTDPEARLPAHTKDGAPILVYGNIESADDVERVKAWGGEGVGLYRTEWAYLARSMPEEEALYADYAKAVSGMAPHRVVLRTLDLGADKRTGEHAGLEEDNPALGLRSIRHSLRYQDIFRRQLRAILRAGALGRAAVMFPLVSDPEEFRLAKNILEETRLDLARQRIPQAETLEVGAMIELPSAVLMAPALAREADFFSLGTNDLIQYVLGVDRGNKYVSHLYQALHPAVLQAARLAAEAAIQAGIRICVCGEMASDPLSLPFLLGMGAHELSVAPRFIPAIKRIIRHMDAGETRALLRLACEKSSAAQTKTLAEEYINRRMGTETLPFNGITGRANG
jgi:phosphotransferase system enzyme I (PtsI)